MSDLRSLVRDSLDFREFSFRELFGGRFVTAPSPDHSELSFHIMVGPTTGIVQIAAFLKGSATEVSPWRDDPAATPGDCCKVCRVNGTTVGICKLAQPQTIDEIIDGLDLATFLVLKSYASPNRSSLGAEMDASSSDVGRRRRST